MAINNGENTATNVDVPAQSQSPSFSPDLQQRYERMKGWVDAFPASSAFMPDGPVLHYTSLEGCIGILESDSIWMSSVQSLNDLSVIKTNGTVERVS